MTRTDLPKRVYLKHSRYYYVTPAGKWIGLTREKEGIPAMLRALARVMDTEVKGDMMPAVITRWIDQKRDEWSAKQAADQERIAGKMAKAMIEFQPSEVTTPVAAAYLKKYRDKPRTHNLHRTMLRGVLAFAAIEGLREGFNPVDNIPAMKLTKRIRIVTDDEVKAMRASALLQSRNGEALVQMIDLAMLTGQRIGDVLSIRRNQITDEGIVFKQQKTGAQVLVRWSRQLRATVAAAEALSADKPPALTLLRGRYNGPPDYKSVLEQWHIAREAAGVEDALPNDGRAKSATTARAQGLNAQALLGHASPGMTARYLRDRSATEVRGPNIRQALDVGRKSK